MFLRHHGRIRNGKEHSYWSLVETVRTADGPRQRTLCYLGELNGSAHARWQKTIEVFNEQGESTQLRLFPSGVEVADDSQVARVLVKKVRVERTRKFGDCYLGWELWKRLQLDDFFARHLDGDQADVPWSRVAAVLAINRLCDPGSELAVEQHWYPSTALEELLHVEKDKINDTRLYRCLDRLLPLKTKLEQHLKERYGELFQTQFDVLLYDLTSTYVEGEAGGNPMMRRGYSRDHRPDCEQLVLALIVNCEGFPFSYEVFDGNRPDVTTLEVILRTVERKYGKARRVWIFDRGVVSEDNLAAIRRHGGQYLVGTPRRQLKQFEAELLKGDFERIRPDVEVKHIPIPGGEETYILCRTMGRKEKEKAMRGRFVEKIENALGGLEKRIARGALKDRLKMERNLGRIQACHPHVADLYEMTIEESKQGTRLVWRQKPEQQQWLEAREGAYLLRANLTADSAAELWKQYIQLTEVEAAFRTLKSELAIRPLFHQLEKRVKAHILVAFLGYALLVTLKHLLKRSASQYSPAEALKFLAALHSVDIVLPTIEGREIWLRRITKLDDHQEKILHQLQMQLPERLEPIQIQNVVQTAP
ncbi:MAG: IS1634 family transposase [Acidobacteria bacterium]|nr:IS1634 family transposase [Acidobacteriota bacterium]MBV9481316.1 IS1634 family transposase [Acidobacteriota bacterium]